MIIRTSHLAARFYISDGWTKEILDSCMEKGEIELTDTAFFSNPYFRLVVYSRYDVDKLLKHVTKIQHYRGHMLPKEKFRECLESLNW